MTQCQNICNWRDSIRSEMNANKALHFTKLFTIRINQRLDWSWLRILCHCDMISVEIWKNKIFFFSEINRCADITSLWHNNCRKFEKIKSSHVQKSAGVTILCLCDIISAEIWKKKIKFHQLQQPGGKENIGETSHHSGNSIVTLIFYCHFYCSESVPLFNHP